MPTSARATRRQLRAAASFVVSAFFVIAAAATVGVEPAAPTPIPDAAFGPVVLLPGSGMAGAHAAQGPNLDVIVDPLIASPPPPRPQPVLPTAKPVAVPVLTHRLSGAASWYCRAGTSPCTSGYADGGAVDAYAAAGPRLRAALGSSWRGRVVYVDGLRVKLIDWCQCHAGESNEKLLDLYYDVYARVGGSVTVRW
ncbi:MAG: hypothetical protein HYX55_03830 [Chloroflexi bacterium]|nr:hypothetical protein [Chloroflexota bacterium]